MSFKTTFLYLLTALTFVAVPSLAQVPDTLWTKTFGGSYEDWGSDVKQTDDGGFIVTGGTEFFDEYDSDAWLIKTDADGNEMWNHTFGGAQHDNGECVQVTADGGYIVAGTTRSFGAGGRDVWLIKTDADGNELWSHTFGGTENDNGYSVQQTADGGFIITGHTESFGAGNNDVCLIKTDADGNEVWAQTFGGTEYDKGYSVQQTSDGGYIITGETESFSAGWADVYLIKTDADGNEVWSQNYGGTEIDQGMSVQQTTDGGYIITGITESFGAGYSDLWLIKTSSDGTLVWSRTFGGTDRECGYGVQQTADGGYIVTGLTKSFGAGYDDLWLIKTDADGIELWSRTLGGEGDDEGRSIQPTADGGYIITGRIWANGEGSTDLWLIRLESEETQPLIELTLTAPDPLIIPQGGSFEYDALLVSNLPSLNFVDIWTEAVLPNSYVYGPIWQFNDFPMTPNTVIEAIAIGQAIPLTAPLGTYTFRLKAGNYPNDVLGQDEFSFEIVAATGSIEDNEWDAWGYQSAFAIDENYDHETVNLPSEFVFEDVYPNPFNPTTTIAVVLPTASELRVSVFNTVGREVVVLTNGQHSAGHHSFTFDGSNLSSGLFFVHMSVPGETNQLRKIVLMK